MKKLTLLLLLLNSFYILSQSVYQFNWALAGNPSPSFSGTHPESDLTVKKISSNSLNEVVAAGIFQNTTDFDPGTGVTNLTCLSTARNAFFAKYTTTGSLIWAKSISGLTATISSSSGVGNVLLRDMTIDSNDDIIVAGAFYGAVDFDPGSGVTSFTTSSWDYQCFIAKYNGSTGALIFAKILKGGSATPDSELYSCTTDKLNNIYVTGYFTDYIDLDPSASVAGFTAIGSPLSYNYEAFFAKYSPTGNYIYGKQLGGADKQYGREITLDKMSNVIVVGTKDNSIDMDPTSLTKSVGGSLFIGKYSNAGNFIWAGGFGGLYHQWNDLYELKTDSVNNIYLLGEFYTSSINLGVTLFGGSPVNISITNANATGDYDGFIMKLDSNGVNNVQTGITAFGRDNVRGIHIHGNGIVSFARYSNAIGAGGYFGKYNVVSNTINYDSFCSQGSANYVRPNCYYVDRLKNVYVGGYYFGSTDLDPSSNTYLINTGATSLRGLFMAKYYDSSNCTPPPAPVTNSISFCAGNSGTITATGSGILAWYSSATGGTAIITGTAFATPILTTSTTYYVEDSTCAASIRTPVTVSVIPLPTVTVNSGSICSGNSFTIAPTGASTYTVQGGSLVVNPTSSSTYSVVGSTTAGCVSSVVQSSITVNALPVLIVSSTSSLLCAGQTASLSASGANTYTWNPGGNGSQIVISPTITTTYTVNGTDANGCENSSIMTQSVSTCSGVHEVGNNNPIYVYPNPTNGQVTINSEALINKIIVNDVLGKQIAEINPNSISYTIDLSKYENGIYFITVFNYKQAVNTKILKN